MDDKTKELCTNILSDLYSCRNYLENGQQIRSSRKLQGAITRLLELFKLLGIYNDSVAKEDSTV